MMLIPALKEILNTSLGAVFKSTTHLVQGTKRLWWGAPWENSLFLAGYSLDYKLPAEWWPRISSSKILRWETITIVLKHKCLSNWYINIHVLYIQSMKIKIVMLGMKQHYICHKQNWASGMEILIKAIQTYAFLFCIKSIISQPQLKATTFTDSNDIYR